MSQKAAMIVVKNPVLKVLVLLVGILGFGLMIYGMISGSWQLGVGMVLVTTSALGWTGLSGEALDPMQDK